MQYYTDIYILIILILSFLNLRLNKLTLQYNLPFLLTFLYFPPMCFLSRQHTLSIPPLRVCSLNGKQIPIIICLASHTDRYQRLETKRFLIKSDLFSTNQDLALKELWSDFFNFLKDKKY